ncbi:MAG: small conductance mechanosensitive channel [Flavobacteriales bacterium]|jgi:small conductance mechanosensitive channel
MSGNIVNNSMQDTRRVDLLVGVSCSSNLAEVKQALMEIVESEDRILKDPDYTIAVSELAASSVNLVVRVGINTPDYWSVYFRLTEEVKLRFDEKVLKFHSAK